MTTSSWPPVPVSYTHLDVYKRQALKTALDNLFNHPNVGPFIGKQLIQRLVTSNPSPAYVARVAAAFNNNGAGVRGDLRAVVKAILLDDEARSPAGLTQPGFGKLREPMLRFVPVSYTHLDVYKRQSLVSLPHCSIILPLNCFQLPLMVSSFMV